MTTAQALWISDMQYKGINIAPDMWSHQCETVKKRYEEAVK